MLERLPGRSLYTDGLGKEHGKADRLHRRPICARCAEQRAVAAVLAAQPAQQVLRVDGLGKDLELVALGTCFFQQVGGGCLAGEEQDLD
jgi:hypothetical protein